VRFKAINSKRTFQGILIVINLALLFTLFCNWQIDNYTEKYLYDEVELIPENKVGLVLGTSMYLKNGTLNLYFSYRIDAAVKLYKAGKIKYIIVSGDNKTKYYNEPLKMKKELIKEGVPDSVIVLDYAGFRTFDSMIRCKEIFGQNKFTIISQEFQNKRAVFIARKSGMDAVAYNAKDVEYYGGLKTRIRELLAKVKAYMDIYIFKSSPEFLGEKQVIP
jgi:SanA protein